MMAKSQFCCTWDSFILKCVIFFFIYNSKDVWGVRGICNSHPRFESVEFKIFYLLFTFTQLYKAAERKYADFKGNKACFKILVVLVKQRRQLSMWMLPGTARSTNGRPSGLGSFKHCSQIYTIFLNWLSLNRYIEVQDL